MPTFEFAAQDLEHPVEEIVGFVDHLIAQTLGGDRFLAGHDRRCEKRYRLALSVVARPINEDLEPTGKAFMAVTKDISAHGISLFHREPVESKLLALRLTDQEGQGMTGVMEVLRCRPVDEVFEIAGKFVARPHSLVD